jgi:hypothetical protein
MKYPNFGDLKVDKGDKVFYIEPPDPEHGFPEPRIVGLKIVHRHQPLNQLERIILELEKPFKEDIDRLSLKAAKEMYGTQITFKINVEKRTSSTMLVMRPPTVCATTEEELKVWMTNQKPRIFTLNSR